MVTAAVAAAVAGDAESLAGGPQWLVMVVGGGG